MTEPAGVVAYLFTDIEGSSRLWEREPDRMRAALAHHDAIVRAAILAHRGKVVKTLGDGFHAVFADPLDGVAAAVALLRGLADPAATADIEFRVRCGIHVGSDERRDDDFYGRAINRAARIMSVAHGGQILVSEAAAAIVRDRLPAGAALADLGVVRLRDLERPERAFQVNAPGLRAAFPALRTLEATPNNLPQQMTSFVGRDRELAEVRRLLADARLLTLFGPGGIGKTRLSLQAAAEAMDEFPDGAWFVELASLADPALVPLAVATVLGVKEEAGRPVNEALVRFVADRKLLLVLDNCEHLVAACADLAKQLLQAGPRLRILASSREHLRVAGETTYTLPALAYPDAGRALGHADLATYESARLFVERATAHQPAFAVTDDTAAAVAEICRRLDGIPLALELAAARVRMMSVDKIAARLSDRFRLLKSGDATVLPRQQTLQALIDWSHDLLAPNERALLRRIAVFAGGFTLEAAEHVGADGDLAAADVLDLLTQLVEKSLVATEADGGRYRLLETVREYAQERLAAAGEGAAARGRHFAHCLAFVEAVSPELRGPRQAAALDRVDAERENLLAAHAFAGQMDDGAEPGLRLVSAANPYLLNRGLLALAHRLGVEALARPGAQVRNLARCRGLFDAGQSCCWMGRYEEAQRLLEESLAIARELADPRQVEMALQPLGMALHGQGRLDEARRHFEEAVVLARELGDRRELAAALVALAQLHRGGGELDAAQPLYEQAVLLLRETGDREGVAIGLLNLAMTSIGRGERAPARAMLAEAAGIAADIGSRPAGLSALEVTAGLAAAAGDAATAAQLYGAAEALNAAMGIQRDPTDEAFLAPLIAGARAALGASAHAAADAAGRAWPYAAALGAARGWLAGAA
jgi:predicted ATPase/class 3 adenylate cyclase